MVMLAIALFWPLLCKVAIADEGASRLFNIDASCSGKDLNSLYYQTVALADSCDDDFTMLLDEDGVDLDDDEGFNANVAWNTRHALGVRNLVKAWEEDDDTSPKTYHYPTPHREKLARTQGYLEEARDRLEGSDGGKKVDVMCSKDAFTLVDTLATLVDDQNPTVLTVLGQCMSLLQPSVLHNANTVHRRRTQNVH